MSKEQIDELYLKLGFKDKKKFITEVENLLEVIGKVEAMEDKGVIEIEFGELPDFPNKERIDKLIALIEKYMVIRYPHEFKNRKLIGEGLIEAADTIKDLMVLAKPENKEQYEMLSEIMKKKSIEKIAAAKDFEELQKVSSTALRQMRDILKTTKTQTGWKTFKTKFVDYLGGIGYGEREIQDAIFEFAKKGALPPEDIEKIFGKNITKGLITGALETSLFKTGLRAFGIDLVQYFRDNNDKLKAVLTEIPSSAGDIENELAKSSGLLTGYFRKMEIKDVKQHLKKLKERFEAEGDIDKLPQAVKDYFDASEKDKKDLLEEFRESLQNAEINIFAKNKEEADKIKKHIEDYDLNNENQRNQIDVIEADEKKLMEILTKKLNIESMDAVTKDILDAIEKLDTKLENLPEGLKKNTEGEIE